MINRLAIIGMGLIGGSLSLALKQAGKVQEVIGFSRQESTRQQALALGIVDRAPSTIIEAVQGADMVVLAVPMGAMADTLMSIAPYVTDNMVITDAGSAKAQVVEAAKLALGDRFKQFVPGHPIAGTEKSGPTAAFAQLYQDHRVVLTPTDKTDLAALEQVHNMWLAAGAQVSTMSAIHHDHVLAATSHLPHLLAFNLVDMLAQDDDVDEVLRYAAGGFRDFSRIASSDPVMWRDICLSNSEAILGLLKQSQHQMNLLQQAIEQQNGDYLMTVFERAKRARDTRFNDPDLIDNSEV
jgi:prephenate dehydrogenase